MTPDPKNRYALWLKFNAPKGTASRASGYGAAPHGDRLEGYPKGQTTRPGTARAVTRKGPIPVRFTPSRDGLPRAMDAASRPENLPSIYP